MKPLKTSRKLLTDKIRDNTVLARYSTKEKAKELIDENKSLRIQLDEMKIVKRF